MPSRGCGREVNGVFRGATLRVNLVKLLRSRLFGQMLQVACWLRGARHVRFRHSYDFAMSSYILRNRLRIIGG